MGSHLCKDARGDDCLHEFGTYEELDEDSSAGKVGYLWKTELQISQQCCHDVCVAENENEKFSIDVLRMDETEMKPECYSMSPPTDDAKLSIAVSTTSCSIAKEQLNLKNIDSFQVEAVDASDRWVDIVECDITNIGRSYVMPDLEELPLKLLPVDSSERHTVPLINLNNLKRSKEWSLWATRSPSLFNSEVEAIKKQMERLEKQSISKLSPNKLDVPNDTRYIKAEFQDFVAVGGDEYEEVDDKNTGGSDSLPNCIGLDFIEQKTAEQMTDSSDSASTKYSEHSYGECLETANIERVQQS